MVAFRYLRFQHSLVKFVLNLLTLQTLPGLQQIQKSPHPNSHPYVGPSPYVRHFFYLYCYLLLQLFQKKNCNNNNKQQLFQLLSPIYYTCNNNVPIIIIKNSAINIIILIILGRVYWNVDYQRGVLISKQHCTKKWDFTHDFYEFKYMKYH